MKSLHYRVNEFLRSHNIPHSEDSERGEIVVLARLEHGFLITKIRIDPNINYIGIRTLIPVEVPAGRKSAVAEFAMAFHWSIKHGRFQLDLNDGELQFVTSAILGNTTPDDEFLMHLLVGNHLMADSAIPSFEAIAKRGQSPAETLEDFHSTMRETAQKANTNVGAGVQPSRTRSMFGSGDQLSAN